MDFIFSKHSIEQLKLRGISKKTVRDVLTNPLQIIDINGKQIYQSIIYYKTGEKYLIRIFVNSEKKPKVIITVYITSKISKYYEDKI